MTKLRWVLLVLNLFLVIGLFFLIQARGSLFSGAPKNPLPSYGQVPDFTLTEKDGSWVTLETLKGKVWVADFIFTRCAGQCPIMNQKMRGFQEELPDLTLVSFSVDPDTDTPEVLAEYAKSYGADPDRWLFLTGDKETLNRVAQGFHVTGLGDPMFHSVSFALVDPQGEIRGYYDSNDAKRLEDLIKDAHDLIKR